MSERIDSAELRSRVRTLIDEQVEVVTHQLRRNNITIIDGMGSFVSPHEIKIETPGSALYVRAKNVLIAVGSRPAHAPHIPFDGETIFDADQILKADLGRRDWVVVGCGVIGLEYASMLSALPGMFSFDV